MPTDEYLEGNLFRLQAITENCSDTLNVEEEDISADVIGMFLGNDYDVDTEHGEFCVVIKKGNDREVFNLCTIIALARKACI